MKLFWKKESKACSILACTSGATVAMKDISDTVFSEGILGVCVGIDPDVEKIISPADGVITQVSETSHALGINADCGAEILIHVGIDTVQLMGEGFSVLVSEGEKVCAGKTLMTFDKNKIREAGYDPTVITAITNSSQFADVKLVAGSRARAGEALFEIQK